MDLLEEWKAQDKKENQTAIEYHEIQIKYLQEGREHLLKTLHNIWTHKN